MILVTGGTGMVGSHLLYFLLKDGQTVRAIRRKSSDLKAVKEVFLFILKLPKIEKVYLIKLNGLMQTLLKSHLFPKPLKV